MPATYLGDDDDTFFDGTLVEFDAVLIPIKPGDVLPPRYYPIGHRLHAESGSTSPGARPPAPPNPPANDPYNRPVE